MAYSQRLTLEAPEACTGKGIYRATAYVAERRSEPKALPPIYLGKHQPDATDLIALTNGMVEKLALKYRDKLIGYSVLKLCDTRHTLRLERFGNFAIPNFAGEPLGRVHSLAYKTPDEDVCWATYYETADIKRQHRRTVDFPSTAEELQRETYSSAGIYLVDAIVSRPEPRDDLFAAFVMRPHVQLVLPKGVEL